MKLKNLCTICARGGSKGVPGKNIRPIAGKPLIAHSIEQAQQTGLFDHIVISTDSDDIAAVAQQYGGEVIFKRPAELSADTAAKIPVIRHAFVESEKHFQEKYDILVDLDATSPLRTAEDITNAYKQLLANNNVNLITGSPARRSPYFNLVELNAAGVVTLSKKLDSAVVRRQDAPACFDMNASIYIWKRETILDQDRLFLDTTGIYVMPEERSFDIDNQFDFEIVEWIMERRISP